MTFKEIVLGIGGDATGAKNALREASAGLIKWGRQKETAEAELDIGSALRDVGILLAMMEKVDRSKMTVEARVEFDEAKAELLLFRQMLRKAASDEEHVTTRTDRLKNSFRDLGETLKPDSVKIGAFSFSLSRAGTALLFLAGTILKSVIGALAAMASSLVQAAGGLGALAVAAGAALAPVAALAAATIGRFTQAKKATDDLRAAMLKLHTAEKNERSSQASLAAALRQRVQAQQDLARVTRTSQQAERDDLRTAAYGLADAEQAVASAQISARDAQVALNEARRDAVRQLEDLRDAARGAELSEKAANLALIKARNELRALEANPGTPNMALRNARLAVQQAELGVHEARQQGQRSQEDLNRAEHKGVEGSDAVVAAREAMVSANQAVTSSLRDLSDAQRENTRALRDAQRRNEQVVSARHAVQDANRQVAASQRDLALATEKVARAQHKVNQLQERAKEFGPGSPARELRQAARDFRNAFLDITKAGSDRIFKGITDGLDTLRPKVRQLRGAFTRLGGAIGRAFRRIGGELASPRFIRNFEKLTRLAAKLAGPGTRAMIQLLRLVGNVADAASPFLVDAFKGMADAVGSIADSTKNTTGLRLVIGAMVDQLNTWLKLIKQVGRLFLNFVIDAGPAGQDLVDWLAEGASNIADFLASAKGQNAVKEFFKDTIPVVQNLIGLVGDLLVAFILFSQMVGPLLAPALGILRAFVKVVDKLLAKFQDLPEVVQLAGGALLLFLGPLRIIKGVYRALKLVLGALLLGKWSKVLGPISGLFETLGLYALYAWGWMRKVAAMAAGRLLLALRGLIGLGVAGAMERIGLSMLALAAEGGPIALLILALVLIVTHWEEVKNAVNDAKDAITDFFDKKFLNNQGLMDALGQAKDLAKEVKQMARDGDFNHKMQDAGKHAGKAAVDAIGKGMKRAAQQAGKTGMALDVAGPLAAQLKTSHAGGHHKKGDLTMNNTFITSSGKMSDDREAVAAISRRLRQRGLSLA